MLENEFDQAPGLSFETIDGPNTPLISLIGKPMGKASNIWSETRVTCTYSKKEKTVIGKKEPISPVEDGFLPPNVPTFSEASLEVDDQLDQTIITYQLNKNPKSVHPIFLNADRPKAYIAVSGDEHRTGTIYKIYFKRL